MHFSDFVGVGGVIITLIAYFLLQIGRIRGEGWRYSLLNAIGALMIIFSLIFKWNTASFLMEGTWFLLSVFGVVKEVYFKKPF